MKKLAQRFVLWLAKRVGLALIVRPRDDIMASAIEFVKHVDKAPNEWQWKQRQCIRAMMNRFPQERIRTLNLAIELAVAECLAS